MMVEQGDEVVWFYNYDDIDDDDKYDNTDLFCEEDHEEDYDLCSGCDAKPIAHFVQPCGHKICTNCVQKNNCQLCGCRISNNVTIHFDEVECYFHVFQCFNLDGAVAYLFFNLFHFVNFCNILTILCSMLFNESIDLDKFQELVDFGRSFCFS